MSRKSPFERMRVRVTHIDEWRFSVPSETDGEDPYLVDLAEFDGNGQCSCPHFQMRLEPVLSRGINTDFMRCKHIDAAMDFALPPEVFRNYVLTSMIRTGNLTWRFGGARKFEIPELPIPRVPPRS